MSSLEFPQEARTGLLSLISLGPGDFGQMTSAAQTALQAADIVIGYQVYLELVRSLLHPAQQLISSPIGHELERAGQAIDLAAAGHHVALISSGDIGIYAMASPVFELLQQRGWPGQTPEVEVYPGVSAIQAVAGRLGAPLGHDFCTISLSDLLTPWQVIERRLQAAAWGDFVVGFYNPRSQKRDWQLQKAIDILLAYRPRTTPVALARNVTRPDEQIRLTTLAELDPTQVDMFSLVLVGNSQSFRLGQRLVTPRGYNVEDRGLRIENRELKLEDRKTQISENSALSSTLHPPSSIPDAYPITLISMSGVQAVVVGGGAVGQRKTEGLLKSRAKVRLISPEARPQLQAWAESGQIEWLRRPYQTGDLAGASLVFAATNQRDVNAQVAAEARERGLLCNVADRPAEGNFHVPAVYRQPGLLVAVSTHGQNPGQARQVRDKIAAWLENGGWTRSVENGE